MFPSFTRQKKGGQNRKEEMESDLEPRIYHRRRAFYAGEDHVFLLLLCNKRVGSGPELNEQPSNINY